jgi:hypothetical protein
MKINCTLLFLFICVQASYSKAAKSVSFNIKNTDFNRQGIVCQYVGKSVIPLDTLSFLEGKAAIQLKLLKPAFRYCVIFTTGDTKYGFDFCGETRSTVVDVLFDENFRLSEINATKGSNSAAAVSKLTYIIDIFHAINTANDNYYNPKSDSTLKNQARLVIDSLNALILALNKNSTVTFPKNKYAALLNKSFQVAGRSVFSYGFYAANIDTICLPDFNPELFLKNRDIPFICTPEFFAGLRSYFIDINKINRDSLVRKLNEYHDKHYFKIAEFRRVVYDVLLSLPYNRVEYALIEFYDKFLLQFKDDVFINALDKYTFKGVAELVRKLQNGKRAPNVDIRTWNFKNISIDSLPEKKTIIVFYDYNSVQDLSFLRAMKDGYEKNTIGLDKEKIQVLIVSVLPDKSKAMRYLTEGEVVIPEWMYGYNLLNGYPLKNLYGSNLLKSNKIYFLDEKKTIIDKWDPDEESISIFLNRE